MELSGKAKEKFEKWAIPYFKENLKDYSEEEWGTSKEMIIQFYEGITKSMQYGVYVDFFDSVGVIIDLKRMETYKGWLFVIKNKEGVHLNNYMHNRVKKDSRPEARTKAIEKANDLLNERL